MPNWALECYTYRRHPSAHCPVPSALGRHWVGSGKLPQAARLSQAARLPLACVQPLQPSARRARSRRSRRARSRPQTTQINSS